jgi:putative nucleotidyltransferase with HDIG domain
MHTHTEMVTSKRTMDHPALDKDCFFHSEDELTIYETMSYVELVLSKSNKEAQMDFHSTKNKLLECMKKLLENPKIVGLLSRVRLHDDDTFEHSINVGVLSIYVSILLGFSDQELFEMGAGAILHDVGKTKIPTRILKKPEKLTPEEFEEMKKHTQYGFEIIMETGGIPSKSAYIAKYHHERNSGRGYPEGLIESEIKREAKIVAIADVYDALASERIYRNKMDPIEVVNYILVHEPDNFDEEIFKLFLKFVGVFPLGMTVRLNNNSVGVVVKENVEAPSRPIIKILQKDEIAHKIESMEQSWGGYFLEEELDLTMHRELHIREFC